MSAFHTAVISDFSKTEDHIDNHFRLIRTMDIFHQTDVFSVFLTTRSPDGCYEEFVYDIARNYETAETFFNLICKANVTALSLCDVAEDFISGCV